MLTIHSTHVSCIRQIFNITGTLKDGQNVGAFAELIHSFPQEVNLLLIIKRCFTALLIPSSLLLLQQPLGRIESAFHFGSNLTLTIIVLY